MFSNYAILGRYLLSPRHLSILEQTSPGYNVKSKLNDGCGRSAARNP
jgi:UTP-glucose-1-phosphate uridylyltransferase